MIGMMLSLGPTLYAALIRLYPSAFRATFGAELHAVFCAKLADARPAGAGAILGVWLHEMSELPGNLLSEYWSSFMGLTRKGFESMRSTPVTKIILVLPPGLLLLLCLCNINYTSNLLAIGLGWLILGSFCLSEGLNVCLYFQAPERINSMALVAGVAMGGVVIGPALVAVTTHAPLAVSEAFVLTAYAGLIVLDLVLGSALVGLTLKRRQPWLPVLQPESS